MPTSVVALRGRSIRASSTKIVVPGSGRLVLLVSPELSVSSALSDLAANPRIVRKLRGVLGLGREPVSQTGWLLGPGFSGSAATADLATEMRAIAKLRPEHGLCRESGSRASSLLALRAGVLRRAK